MAIKKTPTILKKTYEIEGPPWSLTDTPWGMEADYARRLTGNHIDICRDYVILRYLLDGDTRPLAALMALGHAPGPAILKHLADMLQPADSTEDEIKYALKPKRRNGDPGPRINPELKWLGLLEALNVQKLMGEGAKYEFEAIPKVAEMLPNGLKAFETVRAEYDKRKNLLPKQ